MATVLAVLSVAALFALYGLLRPRAGCGGECAACDSACPARESNHDAS